MRFFLFKSPFSFLLNLQEKVLGNTGRKSQRCMCIEPPDRCLDYLQSISILIDQIGTLHTTFVRALLKGESEYAAANELLQSLSSDIKRYVEVLALPLMLTIHWPTDE